MARQASKKMVTGFVVKQEKVESDPYTKATIKRRIEVSRVYHSRDAAEMFMSAAKRHDPSGDFYIHEKTRRDEQYEIQ